MQETFRFGSAHVCVCVHSLSHFLTTTSVRLLECHLDSNRAHDNAQDGRHTRNEDSGRLVLAVLLFHNGAVHESRVDICQGVSKGL
jgi:hypothetical protein